MAKPVIPPVLDKQTPLVQPFGPFEATSAPRPAAVSPAQYAAEQAAAVTGPAPTGATKLTLPPGGAARLSITASFLGLNRQTAANNGFVFIPPDTILGKSLTQVIEATNSAIRFTDTAGGVLATTDLNTFFGARI